jgi:hypothetical protein
VRTQPCPDGARKGRLAKAEQFFAAADLVQILADEEPDLTDAYITLCVHAGVAAADVLCCARLGEHAKGENHQEAIDLLTRVDRELARHLHSLLTMKTRAAYSSTPSSHTERKRAGRAMSQLVLAARIP